MEPVKNREPVKNHGTSEIDQSEK